MSALALPALALAQRGAQALPALFADLALRCPSPEVTRLDSTGYSAEGKGPARYIADTRCDAALLAAHPRFVFRTANHRIFRLLPEAGSLSVEQGGAAGDGAANDQPAIQAAIDYAEAIGGRELRLESEHYRIDCPIRGAPLSDTRAEDGHPLVVRRSLALRGCAPDRSVLDFRGVGGIDPETNWQVIDISESDPSPAVWRGGGIFLQGETIDPDPARRRIARFELERLVLKGNRLHTGQYVWPADTATGDGWDISDKALWLQDCLAGEIVCRDVDMIGWKGEIFYLAGAAESVERLELSRCRLLISNGNAFNPGVDAQVVAEDCEFGECFQAQEDVGKRRAVYRNCLWRDCRHVGLGSGPTDGLLHNISWPTRDPALSMPQTVLLDCEFRDIDQLRIASWVRGSITTFDTPVLLDGDQAMALRDVDLAIDAWLDRRPGLHALLVHGTNSLTDQAPGAPVGVYKQPPSQLRARLRHFRTRQAQDNGLEWLGMLWTGYIEPSCRFECEGDYANTRTPNGGDNPPSMPFVGFAPGVASSPWSANGYHYMQITGSGALAPTGPAMAIEVASEVTADVALTAYPAGGAEFGYAAGQRLRLVKQHDRGAIRFVKGAVPESQQVLQTRVLEFAFDWIEFAYNRGRARWEECGFFSAI